MRFTLLVIAVGLLVGSVAGCKTPTPGYCDENTPCQDPERPFCDLNGEYPASEGVGRTCIPYPLDGGVDVDAGANVDAMMSPDAAGPAEITISSSSQDFGSVVKGQSSAGVSFTVTNVGGMQTGALAISTSGTDTGDFTTSGDCVDAVLQSSDTCTVTVTFSPQTAGTKSAELDITASPGGDLMVALSGDGLTPGALSISPTSYTFSNTNIAATSSTHNFTITNSGGSATGTLGVTLSNTTDFSITGENCDGASLAPTSSCQVTVKFAPSAVGSALASLVVQASPGGQASASIGGTGTATVAVSKTGTGSSGGTVKSSPAGIDCGSSCSAEFTANMVTLSATTDSNTSFTGWSGGGCSGTGTCTVSTAANRSVSASFATNPAEITVSPTSQNFGSVVQGQSSAGVSFTVTNIGGMPTGALAISKSGTNTGDFTASGNCADAVLQPSDTCTVTVTFSPQSSGSKSAELDISASPGGSLMVALSGMGLSPGALSISPTSYTFANTNIASASSTHSFTVTNTGGSSTGTLSATLSNTTDFAITSQNCSGTALAPAGTCQVTVKFTPSAVGNALGSVVVQASPGGQASASIGGTGTATVAVSKTGTGSSGGTVQSSPAGINCGGTCSAEFTASTVTLSATTDSNTSFTGWSGAGCSGTGTCTVSTTANKNVTASFATNPAEITVSPTSQDFGSVVQGQSTAANFTVTNVGALPSGALSVSKSGAATADFTISGNCQGTILQPAGTCTATVTFAPQSSGAKSAELDIAASPGGSLMVPLSGNGLSPGTLSISPTSYTFSDTNIAAASATKTFTVTNTGGSSTGMVGVLLSNTTDFTITSESCGGTTLAPAGTCQVIVKFAPSAVGDALGSVIVQASPGGQASASLGGTGTASISVSKTGSGASGGTVTSTPSAINCGSTCSAQFSATSVTLSATTNASTSFAGWSGAGCSGTGNCVIATTSNKSVSANFLANQCTPNTTSCSGSTLTVCDGLGQIDSTTSCALGCYTDGTRCYDVNPSNGLGTYLDMSPSGGDITLPDGSTIDTSTGEIRDDTNALVSVDSYDVAAPSGGAEIRVFRVKSITMGNVAVNGTSALAIVSDGDITLTGQLHAGGKTTATKSYNGPGGGGLLCSGNGSGGSISATGKEAAGGGGGAFAGYGGNGGSTASLGGGAGGLPVGNATLIPLRGGCAGGGAAPPSSILGGAAGGAVQLVSRTAIRLTGNGELDVSGGGGRSMSTGIFDPNGTPGAGFGGGSGGGALLEAPVVQLASGTGVHANGGGGGCAFVTGADGALTTAGAAGAVCSGRGNGGFGGAKDNTGSGTSGVSQTSGTVQSGGGGGGGIGRIRINSPTYNPLSGSILSPTPSTGTLGTR